MNSAQNPQQAVEEHHGRLYELFHCRPHPEQPARALASIPVDVKEDANGVTVFIDLPGVDEDDIHLDLESNILLVSTSREFDHDNEDADEYVVLERVFGPLKRAINIPGLLDKSGMTAKYKRGVLKVRIPHAKSKA